MRCFNPTIDTYFQIKRA